MRHWAALRPNFGFASEDWGSTYEVEGGGGGDVRAGERREAAAPDKDEGNSQ